MARRLSGCLGKSRSNEIVKLESRKDEQKGQALHGGSKPTLRANPRSVRYQTYSSLFTPTPRQRRRPLPRLVPAKAISTGLDGLAESGAERTRAERSGKDRQSGKDRHCTVGSKLTLRANPRSVRYQTYRSLFTPTPRHRRRPLPRLVPAKAISAGLDGLPESDQAARVEFNEK